MPKDTFFNLNLEKQEKIMRAAISEFINYGFEKGNIGRIASNAGVAKGSMYQYFEDKEELFSFAVKWGIELVLERYNKYMVPNNKQMNLFDFFYQSSKELMLQLRGEREIVIFIQDIFLGKYSSMADETINYMMKVADEHVLQLIRDGKNHGHIRSDIDDKILSLFITGASMKIKEHLMSEARMLGKDMIDEDFEANEKVIKAMLDLLKNGMGT